MTADTSRRAALLLALAGAVAAVPVVDALVSSAPSGPPLPIPASAVIASPSADSSAWYCPGPAAVPSGGSGAVFVTNAGAAALSGVVHSVTAGGSGSADQHFTVPPGSQLAVATPLAASTVSLQGGGAGVFQAASGPLGYSTAPCATTSAANWYFAAGSTGSGAGLQVVLYNPLPTPAVASVTFVSATGPVVPPAYQGIPVAPGSVVVENVSDHVPDTVALATEVTTLSGSVVATELNEFGTVGGGGLSIVDGATAPRSTWVFAQNADGPSAGNTFTVFNPSTRPATVTVSIALAQGRAAPLVLHVAGQSAASLASQDQTRIPPNAPFALKFSSSRGSGIVVARQATQGATGALPREALTAGQPGGIRTWLVPAEIPGLTPGGVAVVDLAGRPVRVVVRGIGANSRLATLPLVLVPGGLQLLALGPPVPAGFTPVLIQADGPIAVELDPSAGGPAGLASMPAWPVIARLG